MKSRFVFAVFCFFFSAVSSRRLSIRSVVDNEVDSGNSIEYENVNAPSMVKSWVKISHPPPREITVKFGAPVELECEASGSPAPIIQWYEDTRKVTDNELLSNEISEFPPQGLAKARARLRIHSAQNTEIYFCRAQSGTKVARASTKVNVDGRNLSAYINEMREKKQHVPARIVFFDTIYMDNIGNTVEFPCKTIGHPLPETIWLDPSDEVIEPASDPRFAILPSGGLRISKIRWNDMGPYTCVTKNVEAQDTITTFLYPMLADK